jgi:hypothetical protein
MPRVSVKVPHALGAEEAVSRIGKLIESIRHKYGDQVSDVEERIESERGTFGFSAQGMRVRGEYEVGDGDVEVSCELPLAAAFFKGRIETEIRDRLIELLR